MSKNTPISSLVDQRSSELAINRTGLVRRMGYVNMNKGLRRLDALVRGELQHAKALTGSLARALEVDISIVSTAMEETRRAIISEVELAERESFKPHAIVVTEHTRPSQIVVVGMIGISNLLRINIGKEYSPIQYSGYVKKKLPNEVPFFGKTLGYVVNYTPDFAIRFDVDGRPVDQYNKAFNTGQVELKIGGHLVPHFLKKNKN